MAKFLVHDTFTIADRGYILAGDITEGEINRGDFVAFKKGTQIIYMQILGLEFGKYIKGGLDGMVLILSMMDGQKLENVDLKEKEVIIHRPDYNKGAKVKDILSDLMDMIEIG